MKASFGFASESINSVPSGRLVLPFAISAPPSSLVSTANASARGPASATGGSLASGVDWPQAASARHIKSPGTLIPVSLAAAAIVRRSRRIGRCIIGRFEGANADRGDAARTP